MAKWVKEDLLPYIVTTGADNGETTIDVGPLVSCIDANTANRDLQAEFDLKETKGFAEYNGNTGKLTITPDEKTKAG